MSSSIHARERAARPAALAGARRARIYGRGAAAAALALHLAGGGRAPAQEAPPRTGSDTARALAALDRAVMANPNDHAAWNRRGRLAMRTLRTESRIAALPEGAPQFKEHEKAEWSLRTAAGLAPDSARYLVDHGEYFFTQRYGQPRNESLAIFDRALDVARRVGGAAGFAETAEAIGTIAWREYEWLALRPPGSDFDVRVLRQLPLGGLGELRNFPVESSNADPGRTEYAIAVALYAAAQRVMPHESRYPRRLLGALAAAERWEEMRRAAARVVAADSQEVAGWVGLGVARQRLRDYPAADSAFAVALSLMSGPEQEAFTRLSRILTPDDARGYERMPPAARAATAQRAWLMLDPLWASPGNEYQLEYLSRVGTAWLRWDPPAPGVHAADAGPGAALVALGPPQRVIAHPSGPNANILAFSWLYPSPRAPRGGGQAVDVRAKFQRWRFEDQLAEAGDVSEPMRRRRALMPVDWGNVTLAQRVERAETHVARFRGESADSGDIYVAAHLPISRLLGGLELTRAPLGVDLWVMDAAGNRVLRDSTLEYVAPADSAGAGMRVWRKRVRSGSYYYRVEAWQPQAMRGARGLVQPAAAAASAMTLEGFGLSDILVAERVAPRGALTPQTRWSDFNIVPNAARLRRGQPYALLWEVYAAPVHEGEQLRYRVDVRLRKVGDPAPRSFLTQVVSGAGAPRGLKGSGRGEVSIGYDRVADASPVSVNYLVLELGDAPPGEYALDVSVTDRASGRAASSAVAITVLE